MRHEGVSGIADEQNDLRPSQLASRNQILASGSIPPAALRAVLKKVMRIDHAGNSRVLIFGQVEREWVFIPRAKVCRQKCAQPGAATFWDGHDDGIASAELRGAAGQVNSPRHCDCRSAYAIHGF